MPTRQRASVVLADTRCRSALGRIGSEIRASGRARPSGTEAVYKNYAESFKDERHLQAILTDAQQIVSSA
jgi:phosphoglucomutase